jgi:hypothetical protein
MLLTVRIELDLSQYRHVEFTKIYSGSIGELIPGMKARIVDDNGNGE